MIEPEPLRRTSLWCYGLCYALYGAVLALCYEVFWLWRSTIDVLLSYLLGRNQWREFYYMVASLLIGIVLFGVAIGAESYLRNGLATGRRPLSALLRRFLHVGALLVGAIVVAAVLQELVYHRLGI